MTVAIARFLGSSYDRDCLHVFQEILKTNCCYVWHDESDLPAQTTAVVIPGGFSYGDYLRCGAIAARRPIVNAIKNFIANGGKVIGICNGFQILCEAKILPGVLRPNKNGRFICKSVRLEVVGGQKGILNLYHSSENIELPIAHHDGNYQVDYDTLKHLKNNNQIALRYVDLDENQDGLFNGSLDGIAGIFGGPYLNVLGLMPHPERHANEQIGRVDGLKMLKGLVMA